MCAQCVASAVPYVALAVGGLQAMRWKATRGRTERLSERQPESPTPRPSSRP